MKKVIVTRKALQARIAKHLKSYGQTLRLDKRMKVYYILEGERIIDSRLTWKLWGSRLDCSNLLSKWRGSHSE